MIRAAAAAPAPTLPDPAADTDALFVGWLEGVLDALRAVPLRRRFGVLPPPRPAVLLAGLRNARGRPGVVLEFGVYKGRSINRLAAGAPERSFIGFDSFAGLPADGRGDWQVDFAVDALPQVPANVRLVKGWFEDTVGPALAALREPVAMVHIDCDIYSSTVTALTALRDHGHLAPGLVVVCDDAINYPAFAWNELAALHDVLLPAGLDLAPLAVHRSVRPLAQTLTLFREGTHPQMHADQAAGYRQQAAFTVVPRTRAAAAGSAEGCALYRIETLARGRRPAG